MAPWILLFLPLLLLAIALAWGAKKDNDLINIKHELGMSCGTALQDVLQAIREQARQKPGAKLAEVKAERDAAWAMLADAEQLITSAIDSCGIVGVAWLLAAANWREKGPATDGPQKDS